EVLVDGGVRWGSDVIRALALGARAVMIGRAWAYGLAAAGEPGIEAILSTLRVDMDRTLRLLGCQAVTDLDRSFIRYPSEWDKPGGGSVGPVYSPAFQRSPGSDWTIS